jgi:TonB family protein
MRDLVSLLILTSCLSVTTVCSVVAEENSVSTLKKQTKGKALATYAPRPAYPMEARRDRLTGSGVALLEVDKRTGYVTSARMLQSIGHKILDDAALKAFRQWRFKPGTKSEIKIPINYTIGGRFYK